VGRTQPASAGSKLRCTRHGGDFFENYEGGIMAANDEPRTETLAETDEYVAWKAYEPDGEVSYHLTLNNVTIHFFEEEWVEFIELVKLLAG
jgi:hypothetical protein